ncbi:MAG: substrate-binding domain-containing protein [Dethiobacter sp.]|jgi:tungstate transport system substrate-binding protein|nr:substrate-binding domain-containing protein [Dethiobacter sp.]
MWKKMLLPAIVLLLAVTMIATGCAAPQEAVPEPTPTVPTAAKEIILATTTSTQDSGLLDRLIPMFEEETGHIVKTIAVGSGAALALGERGEADLLLVHAPEREKRLLESGNASTRELVMFNDFVIVGPADDPAGIKGMATAAEALAAIAAKESLFVSRGDNSGTHIKEMSIWSKAEIEPAGNWYMETGSGMGDTLNITSEKQGYTLTDRGTYLARKEQLALEILVEGEAALLNIYHVMQVNPDKFPKVNGPGARAFADFILSPTVQEEITKFGVDRFGQPLFFPAAGKNVEDLGN